MFGGKKTKAGRGMRNMKAGALKKSGGLRSFAKMGKVGKLATGAGSLGAGLLGDWVGGKASNAAGFDDTGQGDIGSLIGGILGGAAGTLLGPAGTIAGAGLGSAAGKFIGDWAGTDTTHKGPKHNDYLVQNGKLSPIDTNDTHIGFKPGGGVDNMLKGLGDVNTDKRVLDKEVNSNTKTKINSEIKHKFDKIDINININAVGITDDMARAIVNNDTVIRGLNKNITETISKKIGRASCRERV